MATDWILITSLVSLRWVLILIFPLWAKKFLFCSKQFESSFCDLQLKESWQIHPQTCDISCILGSSYCFSLDLEIGSGMFGASSPSYSVQESAVWIEDPFGFLVKYQCIREVTFYRNLLSFFDLSNHWKVFLLLDPNLHLWNGYQCFVSGGTQIEAAPRLAFILPSTPSPLL